MAAVTYSVYGIGLAVDRPLSRLSGARPAAHVHVDVALGSMPPWRDELVTSSSELWQIRQHPGEPEPWLMVWKAGPSHIRLAYRDGVDVLISRNGSQIWMTWPDSLTLDHVSSYLLGPVLGVALRLQGIVCLHASGVALGDKAAVFVGAPGAGKSTTAGALIARGFRVIADDVVPIVRRGDTWLACPGYPCLRLWHDAITTLAPADAFFAGLPNAAAADAYHVNLAERLDSFQQEPLPVGAIYLLDDRSEETDAPLLMPVAAAHGLMDLVANTFANTYLESDARAREFDALADIAAAIPIRRIRAHADSARLPQLCDMILGDFFGDGSPRTVAALVG